MSVTLKFELNERQVTEYRRWKSEHLAKHGPGFRGDSFGAWMKFQFIPTGIGMSASVHCLACGEGAHLYDCDPEDL